MSHVSQWRDDAYATLRKAQEVASQAQASLDTIHHFLAVESVARTRHVLAKVAQVHTQQKECQGVLGHLQARFSAAKDVYSKDLEALIPAVRELDEVQAQLAAIEVPGFLLRSQERAGKPQHLDDFISTEEIELLRHNLAVYRNNCSALVALVEKEFAAVQARWQDLSKKYASFVALQEVPVYEMQQLQGFVRDLDAAEKRPSRKHDSKVISSVEHILEQNEVLGQELVNLLSMLTNHYDQCVSACSWVSGNNSQTADLAVLEADTLELPSVLREVYSIHDILSNNERNLARTVEPKGYDHMLGKCSDLTAALADFQNRVLTRVTVLMAHFSAVYNKGPASLDADLAPLRSFARVLDSLSEHYRQFRSVYQVQYLSELHYEQYVYPRKFLKLIDELFNEKLLAFEDAERDRRQAWLRRYGDFIPSSFQLPGDSEYPSVVQVVSEGLDDLNSNETATSEAKLLELLKARASR